MLRWYSTVYLTSKRDGNQIQVRYHHGSVKAHSEEEAYGVAMKEGQKEYPKNEGWQWAETSVLAFDLAR